MESQTQGRIFIGVGSVGLLIVLYFVVTAFFPGGKETNEKIVPTQELQSGNIAEKGEEMDFDELVLEAQSAGEIHILIPEFLFTSGFQEIAEDIQNTLDIQTKFFLPDDMDVYAQMDTGWTYSGENMDIIMVPVDYMYKFIQQSKVLPITEKIAPYYNNEFEAITDHDDYTFVPHAIDPAVIFSQTEKTPPEEIQDRLDLISNRKAPKRYHVPLVFGIGSQDLMFLKQGRESFADNFFFFYQMMKYTIQGEDPVKEIKTLIDIANATQTNAWNIADFISITNKLAERNIYCKIYPSICIFNYNFADHRFGFTSDITKIEKHFSIEGYNLIPFWHNDTHPARGRGFLIHASDNKGKSIAHFLEGYIQASIMDIHPTLRDNTIPASNAANVTMENTKIPTELAEATNRNILIGDGESTKIFTQETSILEVIAGEYNPELFLEQMNRQF